MNTSKAQAISEKAITETTREFETKSRERIKQIFAGVPEDVGNYAPRAL